MKSSLRGTLIRFVISFGVIGLIVYVMRDKIGESMQILTTEVIWSWFAVAAVCYVCAMGILAARFLFILKSHDIELSYREAYYLVMIGMFFNLFLPSAVGGDVAKAYYVSKHSGKKVEAMSSVVQDRMMGFLALITIAVLALTFFSRELNDPRINQLVYLFVGIMVFFCLFFGSKRFARPFKHLQHLIPSLKWRNRLADFYHAMYGYRNHKGIFIITVLLSLAGQTVFVLLNYLGALSLHVDAAIWIFFLFVPIISIASMAPSAGGLGVREAGAIFMFSRIMPPERALALSILLDILIYSFSFISGLIYAFRGGLKSKVIHEIEEIEKVEA